MMIVETKMTQPVELDEEPVDPQLKRSKGTKTLFLPKRLFNQSKDGRDPVKGRLKSNGHLQSIKC